VKRSVSLLVLTAGGVFGQHLDFGVGVGVKGGFPVTDLLEVTDLVSVSPPALSKGNNYLVGPVAELRLPFGFAIEADGLYRGTEYHLANVGNLPAMVQSSSWEIPYRGKFRFPIPLLKPFVVGGGAYRRFNDLPSEVKVPHNALVGGGGLELRIARVRLSAEGRYLRWGEPPPTNFVRLARSQGEILFGLIVQ
jgi:hypothetical protein